MPTLEEAGVPGCESDTWNALTAPPKTPAGVVAKLNDAANKAMKDPELLDRLQASSACTPGGGTTAQMSDFLKAGDAALGRSDQGRRHSAGIVGGRGRGDVRRTGMTIV